MGQLSGGRELSTVEQKQPFLGSLLRRIITAVNNAASNAASVASNAITSLGGDVTTAGAGAATATVTGVNQATVPVSAQVVGTNAKGQLVATSVSEPLNTPVVSHEWLDSYDATSGEFGQTQPAFTDISGTATPAQLPVATGTTLGIVKPDGTTITITSGVITSVSSGGGGTVLFGSGPPSSGPEVVQSTSAGGYSLPFALPVTSGNLLLVAYKSESAITGVTISDTLGTPYTLVASISGQPNNMNIYAGIAPASGANTVTIGGAPNNFDRLALMEAFGVGATVDATANSYNGSSPYSLPITTTNATDFIFAAVAGYHNVNVFTFSAPFTLNSQSNGADANAIGHYITSAAGTFTLTVTLTAGAADNQPAILVAFKTAVTPPAQGTFYFDTSTTPYTGYVFNFGWELQGGSGPTLQTDGTNNASQTLLNLIAGSNVTLTNSGGGVTIAASGGGGGGGFGAGEATLTAPLLSAFTQDNFSGSTSATTITPGGTTAILLTDPGLGGNTNQLRSLLQTIPTPTSPWTLTARLRFNSILVVYYSFGLVLKDGTSGKYMLFGWGSDSSIVQETDWNNANSFATDFNLIHPILFQPDGWWQWQYDGTDLNYRYSRDGNYFVTLYKPAFGSIYLPNAPSEAGFGMNVNNADTGPPLNAAAMECFSFTLTQP
jgi:hypothetical protein